MEEKKKKNFDNLLIIGKVIIIWYKISLDFMGGGRGIQT